MTGYFFWREKIHQDFGHAYKVELVFEEHNLQKVQIFKNQTWGYFFVLDGIVQFTERDEYIYHEVITYLPASLLKKAPETVLIIGGGDGGVLREIQKISGVKKILQFEIDRTVFDLCKKYFFKLMGDYSDSRVELNFVDGLQGLKESDNETFDLIIVDCTDPVGPAKSLYSLEFYQEIHRALKPDGVFIQQASLPAYFPHVIKLALQASSVFPWFDIARVYVTCYGEELAFILGAKEKKDPTNPLQAYYGKYYHPGLNKALFTLPQTWINLVERRRPEPSEGSVF